MTHHYRILVFLLFAVPLGAFAQGITARVSIEPSMVMEGRSAEYTIAFENVSSLPNMMKPRVEGLAFSDSMQSGSFTQIINGRVSREFRASWTFRATRTGSFEIPGRTIRVEGRDVVIPPLSFEVVPMDEASRTRAFLQLVVPEGPFYVGQAIPARLGMYVRSDQTIGNLAFPQRIGDSFQNTELDNDAARSRVRAQGRIYDALTWEIIVTPIKAGPAELAFTQDIVLQIPSEDDRFTGMFGFNRTQSESLSLSSNVLQTDVLPLPEPTEGEVHRGAVGAFTVTTETSGQDLQAGEPMTITVTVEGEGNFDRIAPPDIPESDDWRVYPPKVTFTAADTRGLAGAKSFEFILIPQNARITATPEFAYSTFDPETATYHTTLLGGEAVTVQPAPEGSRSGGLIEAVQDDDSDDRQRIPEAILPIRTQAGSLGRHGPIWHQSRFWVGNAAIGLVLACTAWWAFRRKRLKADWRLQRRQTGSRKVRKALQEARTAAANGDPGQFYPAVRTALQESIVHLSAQDADSGTLVTSECIRILVDSGTPQSTIEACSRLLENADACQFAGWKADDSVLSTSLADLNRIIPEINRLQK